MSYAVCVIVGVFAGCVSGLGLGGGTVLIPALVFAAGISQREAQVFNLLYFVPTAIAALAAHVRQKNLVYRVLPGLVIFGFIGAVIGATVAVRVDEGLLRKLFGGFLLLLGTAEIFKKN
ncbi:MAG: sulfite exporter TauE/SafE family protein [Clostridiales bacterium]|jgi:uncharacterized membrane protein YfcA|nr:sulfite exporter TauE/SafE family protein [Clostridiales bacterium]